MQGTQLVLFTDFVINLLHVGSRWLFGIHFHLVELARADLRGDVEVQARDGPEVGDDLVEVSGLNIKLSGKLKTDSGSGSAVFTDLGGTTVTFEVAFIDVNAIVVTPSGTAARYALYDFVDAPNPTGFKVLLFDSMGIRVSGGFSWTAWGF